jgi:hypothetical protein
LAMLGSSLSSVLTTIGPGSRRMNQPSYIPSTATSGNLRILVLGFTLDLFLLLHRHAISMVLAIGPKNANFVNAPDLKMIAPVNQHLYNIHVAYGGLNHHTSETPQILFHSDIMAIVLVKTRGTGVQVEVETQSTVEAVIPVRKDPFTVPHAPCLVNPLIVCPHPPILSETAHIYATVDPDDRI